MDTDISTKGGNRVQCYYQIQNHLHKYRTLQVRLQDLQQLPTMSVPKNLRNTYIAPRAPYLKPIVICGIVMALSSRREVISPGSPLYDYVLSGSPSALKYATWIQNGLFYFLFGAHAIETAAFTSRLSKHGVKVLSVAWWKWMVRLSLCLFMPTT